MSDRRIYVASLADYNAGRLHGVHITIDGQDVEEIQQAVNAMLAKSKEFVAEEWAIHDYEGFGKWKIHEWEDFTKIALVGKVLAQIPENQEEPFLYWFSRVVMEQRFDVSDFYDDPDGLEEKFTGEYRGHADSWKDWVLDNDNEYTEMYLRLQTLKEACRESDEHALHPLSMQGEDVSATGALERLTHFLDWDLVARDMQTEFTFDVERATEYGVWIFEDQQ